jgi:chorismate mutase
MAAHSIYAYLFCNAIALLLVSPCSVGLGLDTVRDFLTREEDTIVFSLIERAKHPLNLPAYEEHAFFSPAGRRRNDSFAELFVRESEEIQAKVRPLVRMSDAFPWHAFALSFLCVTLVGASVRFFRLIFVNSCELSNMF